MKAIFRFQMLASKRQKLERWHVMGIDIQVQRAESKEALYRAYATSIEVDQAKQRAATQDALTVGDLFTEWISDGVRRKDGNAELQRQFDANVLPAIGAIAVKDLTEHHLRALLRALVDRGVNRTAVMVRNSLTQMFAWGRKRQPWRKLLVEGDPMDLIEIEKIVSPEYDMDSYRDRVLSAEEIVEIRDTLVRAQAEYDSAPNKRIVPQPIEKHTQLAIWIMLSTLCRVGEMSMARWEHVDLATGKWFLPKANVKDNVADLMVYLSPFALDQFKQLHAVTGSTAWCFPNRDATDHIDVKSISKVRRHYMHHDYAEEKRTAWAMLGDRLFQILLTP
jgi:integrase